MAVLYPDSSALVKRYLAETGTAWMKAQLDPVTNNEVYIVRLTYVEIIAAISRRMRGGSISVADATQAKADFRADFATDYFPLEVSDHLIEQAALLAEKHFLRGYDAVQLAAALEVRAVYTTPILMLSSDSELTTAARAEGLTLDDPNLHP